MKKLLPLMLLPFMVIACNPKKDPVRAAARTGVYGNTIGSFTGTNTCPQGTSGIGTIFDSGQQVQVTLDSSSGTFENRVKALLSATTAPEEIGQISSSPTDSTGVRFQGVVKIDTNGTVVAAQSKMLIKIYDSMVLSGVSEAISIEFLTTNGSTIQGQFNTQSGEGNVTFKDTYGEIRFEGRLDAQTFSGVVKFQNSRHVSNGTPASGTLGQFYVARCGIIQ